MPGKRTADPRRAQCLTWAIASRARLAAAQTATGFHGDADEVGSSLRGAPPPEDLRQRGDLYLGIVALDQALTAARWAAGTPGQPRRPERGVTEDGRSDSLSAAGGPTDLPMPLPDLEAARQRVRAVRNLIVHLDDRLAASLPATLRVDADGLRAGQGGSESGIAFAEWVAWLDALEAWASGGEGPMELDPA